MSSRREMHETIGHSRHREAAYQHYFAEIMREARDANTLANVARRVLNDPEVRADSTLEGMIRACLAEREQELRSRLAERVREEDERPVRTVLGSQFARASAEPRAPSRAQVVQAFERLQHQFQDLLTHYDLIAAEAELAQLAAMQQRYPEAIAGAAVDRGRVDLATVVERKREFDREIETLSKAAVAAAATGRPEEAGRALKRLSSIHSTRPLLLSEARLNEIRTQIEASNEQFEHREANVELVRRERAIAAELRQVVDVVHRFRALSHEIPHDDPRYAAAEAEFQQAVRAVRSHDTEWLADQMIEFDELLARLHDPTGRAEAHVDRFLKSVRGALGHVVREIREITAEQRAAPERGPRPASGLAPPPPA